MAFRSEKSFKRILCRLSLLTLRNDWFKCFVIYESNWIFTNADILTLIQMQIHLFKKSKSRILHIIVLNKSKFALKNIVFVELENSYIWRIGMPLKKRKYIFMRFYLWYVLRRMWSSRNMCGVLQGRPFVRISDNQPVSSGTCSTQTSFAGVTGTMELVACCTLSRSQCEPVWRKNEVMRARRLSTSATKLSLVP